MELRTFKVDGKATLRLAQRMLREANGTGRVEAEVACLVAYASIAEGITQYPAATRDARVNLVISRGARALCEIIAVVGELSDADVILASAPVTGTCS